MQLGPYELLAPIGSGGMGEVFRARDGRLDRDVAIKVLPHHLREDAMALARFQRETRAIAAISHPNILAIHDVGSESGIFYAVTELLEGETLRQRLVQGPVPWREAAEIAAGLADGLAAAHQRGVIHRDLKPENVFLTAEQRVKILDFGLAQTPEEDPQSQENPDTDVMTTPGAIIGTVGYMSPEQLRSQAVDSSTDLFSLGCMFLEMLTGIQPFRRETSIDTMAAILHEPPAHLDRLRSISPPEIESLIGACLEKKREQRISSARDVAAALRDLLAGSAVTSGPVSLPPVAPRKRRRRGAIDSIAVLPFINATGNADAEYLSDGITETLIHTLSHVPNLRVMASSTVFRYKGHDFDPLAAGRTLNVRAVLTGRLSRLGDQMVIRPELVDVDDGTHVWGDQYSRRVGDLLELQQEIAGDIAEKLRLRISGKTRRRLRTKPTESEEAYRLYLKGRHQWNRRTIEGIRRGIEFCEQAIAVDPRFALPWAGIADGYVTLATNVPLAPRETMPRARDAALRALEIDPDLAEAHASLAAVKWWHEWNRIEAEQEFQAAIALSPNYAVAHDAYGVLLAEMKEFDRAIQQIRRAQELDPLSLIIGVHMGLPLLFSGQIDEAIEQFLLTLQMQPDFIPALGWLGLAWERRGDYPKAIDAFERALEINDVAILRASVAHALAAAGETAKARANLDELTELATRRYVSPYDFAVMHTGLGQADQAFVWLDRAVEDRSAWMVFLRVDHRLDPLRSDERFDQVLERSGLA